MIRFLKTLKVRPYKAQLSDEESLKSLNDELLKLLSGARKATVDTIARMLTILAGKLNAAFILPHFLQDYKHLEKYLYGTRHEIVIELIRNLFDESKGASSTRSRCNDMHNLIDYVIENYDIVHYLPEWITELDDDNIMFLKYIDELKAIAINHFSRTAISKVEREEILHTIHYRNEQALQDIDYLEEKIRIGRNSSLWRIAAKSIITLKMKQELEMYEYDKHMRAKNLMLELKLKYARNPADHINRVKELEENYQQAKERYLKYKLYNVNVEKTALDEKNKLLLQLQILIKKYDDVMLQKFRESIELDEELEVANKEMDKLLPIYNQEETVYYEIVVRRREEEERARQLLVSIFTQNRAAKVIQRWLRAIYEARKKEAAANAKAAPPAAKKKKRSIKK